MVISMTLFVVHYRQHYCMIQTKKIDENCWKVRKKIIDNIRIHRSHHTNIESKKHVDAVKDYFAHNKVCWNDNNDDDNEDLSLISFHCHRIIISLWNKLYVFRFFWLNLKIKNETWRIYPYRVRPSFW